jgi:hypothetical protein
VIELGKQYKTMDGRKVRIYAVDGGGHKPIHGAIREGDEWVAASWLQGGVGAQHINSLVEVKPRIKREVWVNVYKTATTYGIYKEKGTADLNASNKRIACVKVIIDCEEGEGL